MVFTTIYLFQNTMVYHAFTMVYFHKGRVLVDVEHCVDNIQQSSSLDVLTESANSANIVSHDENESDHETLDRPSDIEYYPDFIDFDDTSPHGSIIDDDIDGEEEVTDLTLSDILCKWAIENQVTYTALKDLLGIPQVFHPHLPEEIKDIKEMVEGSYYHFGIAYNVRQKLDAYRQMKGLAYLALQINIDGLPLFKRSSKKFWPILAILKGISHSSGPFVIGLFVVMQNPLVWMNILLTLFRKCKACEKMVCNMMAKHMAYELRTLYVIHLLGHSLKM